MKSRFVRALVLAMIVVASVSLGAQSRGQQGGSASAGGEAPDPALFAVGALGASNLYTTYFLLGTLADGYATAAYTASFADELARDVIGLNESSIDVLEELLEDDALAGDDRALVEQMVDAHELLINQAWGLISYVEDETETDEWFEYRRAAWELIQEILRIE